ncbi:MAG: hypothetical protein HOW73_22415 [Polyangiaceae bacterium]|nr:hypothetical protein [Polyangiaceae bacterium]
MTTRTDIEATLARWFAIDSIGLVGVFTGAYAAWPAGVFNDYSSVDAADEFLAAAPAITTGIPSARNREPPPSPRPLWDTPIDFAMIEAARGLFSFDAELGYGGSTIYYLDASPATPLLVRDAHPIIQRAARLVVFSRVSFCSVEKIDLAEHVPFVAGNGRRPPIYRLG